MADIFLSYASEDIALARALARVLGARGWDVWWDHKIPPGMTYVEVIEHELEAARCVIVIWSVHSVASEWVKREAAEGGDRRILVPVRLDDSKLPFEFRRLQAADLRGWQGEPDRPELLGVFERVAEIAPPKGAPTAASERVRAGGIPAAATILDVPPGESNEKTRPRRWHLALAWGRRHLSVTVSVLAVLLAVALTLNTFRPAADPEPGPGIVKSDPPPTVPANRSAGPPAPVEPSPRPVPPPAAPSTKTGAVTRPPAVETATKAPTEKPAPPSAATPTPPPAAAPSDPRPGAALSFAIDGVRFNLRSLPAGEFRMGCSSADTECEDDEKPARRVLVEAFQIGETEVTQEQWRAVMGNNPSDFKGDRLPVQHISWTDAQNFIERLNERGDGFTYRLPTEAEWEYAARAGNPPPASLGAVAWFGLAQSSGTQSRPQTVGTKAANAWGLYDMLGNVAEWCEDWYSPNYQRIVRGGSWQDGPKSLRVSARGKAMAGTRDYSIGLRIVREKR
jgi:hypothetical protein